MLAMGLKKTYKIVSNVIFFLNLNITLSRQTASHAKLQTDLRMRLWVNLVHCVPRGPAGLPVQVVALDEDGVAAHARDPDVALALQLQLDAGPDVLARLLGGLGAMYVREGAQTETLQADVGAGRGRKVAVHRDRPVTGRHLERLADLENWGKFWSGTVSQFDDKKI